MVIRLRLELGLGSDGYGKELGNNCLLCPHKIRNAKVCMCAPIHSCLNRRGQPGSATTHWTVTKPNCYTHEPGRAREA